MLEKILERYVRPQAGILVAILAVGLCRMAVTLSGAPNSTARWFSVAVMLFLAAAYSGWRLGSGGQGYGHLYGVLLAQGIVGHSLTAVGIAIGVLTGVDSVYTAAEYGSPFGARTWGHVLGHLVLVPVGTLPPWLLGALVLFGRRRLSGRRAASVSEVSA